MTTCPCCSNQLLRHIRNNQLTYFCRHCWQDMPVFEQTLPVRHHELPTQLPSLSSVAGVLVHQRQQPSPSLRLVSRRQPDQAALPSVHLVAQ